MILFTAVGANVGGTFIFGNITFYDILYDEFSFLSAIEP